MTFIIIVDYNRTQRNVTQESRYVGCIYKNNVGVWKVWTLWIDFDNVKRDLHTVNDSSYIHHAYYTSTIFGVELLFIIPMFETWRVALNYMLPPWLPSHALHRGNWTLCLIQSDGRINHRGSSVAVVRALTSHQCGPGSIPGPSIICGLSLLLVPHSSEYFIWILQFPSLSKIPIRLRIQGPQVCQ